MTLARRRAALVGVAAVALAGGAAAGAGGDDASSGGKLAHGDRNPPLTATAVAAKPTRAAVLRAIGQRIVVKMRGTSPSSYLLGRVRAGKVGGVILFAPNVRSLAQVQRATAKFQAAARAGGNPPLLVMTDQEGGTVKRFASLPPSRAPRAMGDPAGKGRATGRALRRVGVNVDLAPVADVTGDKRSFLYSRTFRSPGATCAFARGASAGGVVPALKHFPGLGGAPANTDDAPVTLKPSLATLKARASAYRRCGNAGLVMVASARYAAIGRHGPALTEPATYKLLRSLGVTAPTISDSLQAKALTSTPHVPIKAVAAGLDILLSTGSERTAQDLYEGLKGAVERGELSQATIVDGARRIARLKERLK